MADTYGTVTGFVQFDPVEREYSGETLRNLTVRSASTQKNVQVTLWPEFNDIKVNNGDFVAVDGKVTTNTFTDKEGNEREGINISAKRVAVLPGISAGETKVVNKRGKRSEAAF